MGRNRKGRQCGGYGSKKERFVLFRRWQQEVAKVTRKNAQSRQAQRKLADQQRRDETNDADDHIERIKREGALSIASELQKSSEVHEFSSLQERCIYEIARSFDLYSSSCEFTQAFFASFEPWMVSRLAELTAAFKTMSDGNVRLLLLQPTEHLTIGFVRDEKSLAPLFDDVEADHRMAWQFASGHLAETEAESWEDLDVEDVDIVQTQEEGRLLSLSLVSCLGLSSSFLTQLTTAHPYLEHLKIIDCFDAAAGEQVWCELALERGELLVALDPDGRSRIASIPIKDCELAHVRSDGRDCIELTINRGKKETFSSHESSHDDDDIDRC
ncbi:Hypothetical protein PHPALM_8927 [Phytophthora palmivora]|uniref:Uncharacterized protein n=1 Tax=Phytophthora palmivora TaxID=4796 RepID=A0A2P4Y8M0_9STRA|nr:Hypothetical protein PHPALM_8927 [Phytophthora palmivora]